MKNEYSNKDLWTKRFLPHYNATEKFQMITYRLADSLPSEVLQKLKAFEELKESAQRAYIEDSLDSGYGSCLLSIPEIAQLFIDNWKFYEEKYYDLIAYVVMPNHVHVLIKTNNKRSLGKIVWSWKSYVTRFVFKDSNYKERYIKSFSQRETFSSSNAPIDRQKYLFPAEGYSLPRTLRLWNREYWDRFIRDEKHFKNAINYIHNNPVKAGLVQSAEEWHWSSIHG